MKAIILARVSTKDQEIIGNSLQAQIDKLKQSEIVQSRKDVMKQFPELSLGDNLYLNSSIKEISNKEIYSLISNTVI